MQVCSFISFCSLWTSIFGGAFRQVCHFCKKIAFVAFKLIFSFAIIVVELGNIVCVMCRNLLFMCCLCSSLELAWCSLRL